MDLKLIENKQIVERYLLGRLPPPEARFFEQMVRKSPALAERLGLPEALRRTMQLLDDSGHEWREQKPRPWHNPWLPAALGAALLIAVVLAVVAAFARQGALARYAKLQVAAEQGLLAAPARSAIYRIHPARPDERPQVYTIGARVAPTLAQLRLDLGYVKGNLFKVVIKRDDGTYWARLDNQLRDSNNELRFAFNSAAFAAGLYSIEIEAVNLRGDGVPAGRLQLRIEAR